MKKMKFNTVAARTVAFGGVFGLFLGAQAASACTLNNWSAVVGLDETDASQGTIAPGSPNPTAPDEVLSARYSGLCAMAASGQGYVEDTSPGGIDRIRARFYVLANNTEPAVVYEGFNGTTSIFTVAIDASGTVSLSGDGLSQAVTANGVSGNWNSIELDWDAGAGQASLWVNSDASSSGPDGSDNLDNLTSGQMVTSVRLGNLDGAAGAMNFDAYESRRTTVIGRLPAGDANGSGVVNIADAGAIIAEIDGAVQDGQPDCNENGFVNLADVGCVIAAL